MDSPSQHKSPTGFESPSIGSSSRSQYPFPRIMSQQQPGSSRPNMSRHDSTASIASSIGGALDASAQSNASPMSDLSQNAISTLLQPPVIRSGIHAHQPLSSSSSHRQPSARDIPPVAFANIRHVEPSVFQPYLSQVGSLFNSYQRAKQESDEAAPQLFKRDNASNEIASAFLGRSARRDSTSSTASSKYDVSVMSPSEPSQSRPFSPSSGPKKRQFVSARLSTIPDVYFEEQFHLENPRIFDIVSERAAVVPQIPGTPAEDKSNANGAPKAPALTRKALHTNAILQEKLSWYMDTVEVHLISSIATASASFFAALGSLKELHSEAAESIIKIRTLRLALKRLDNEMAEGGLNIIKLRRRRENLHKLGQAADQLCLILEERAHCEELVEDGDLEGADARIDYLEGLVSGRQQTDSTEVQRIDLRQLRALDGLPEVITQLRNRVGRGFEIRFIDALLSDLRQHVRGVPRKETLQRWAHTSMRSRGDHSRSQSVVPAYLKQNEKLRSDLLAALGGLNKTGHTGRAATAYREAILKEIRSLIREHLPSSNDDDLESVTSLSTRGGRRLTQQEKSSILARNLRALDPEGAEDLLVKIYSSVSEALRRLGMQVKLVLDVTSSIDHPSDDRRGMSPVRSPQSKSFDEGSRPVLSSSYSQDDVQPALDLSTLLGQAVDSVQTQVSKVLKVRSEQSAQLPLQEFLRYFTLNRLFADECEAVSGRSADAIKGAVNSQIGDFLKSMADYETQTIIKSLESDKWEAKDIEAADSAVLSRVLEGMTRTPAAWTAFTQMWTDSLNGTAGANGVIEASPREKTRSATIDEQKYILVASAPAILHSIDHFENLIAGIPSLAVDASTKLLELLKLFNSRCVQLILGSGARQTAGLRSITTKHLALASQTISFVVAIIPYVREFVRRQSPTANTVLPEFDKVKRLFQDHQVGIHDKLVEIMSGRSAVHVEAMKKIDWDAVARDKNAPSVSAYMETLTKETATLHKVLSRHVSEMDVMMIMTPIFTSYNQDWTQAFRDVVVKTEAGKARMLRDVEYLDSKFGKLDGSGDLGKAIVAIVKDKEVERVPSPVRPPSPEALFDAEAASPTEETAEPDAGAADPTEASAEANADASAESAPTESANHGADAGVESSTEIGADVVLETPVENTQDPSQQDSPERAGSGDKSAIVSDFVSAVSGEAAEATEISDEAEIPVAEPSPDASQGVLPERAPVEAGADAGADAGANASTGK